VRKGETSKFPFSKRENKPEVSIQEENARNFFEPTIFSFGIVN